MARKRARNKTRGTSPSGKGPVDPPFKPLPNPGQAKAMSRSKAVEHVQPTIYDPPPQEKRFDRLGIPRSVYGKLRDWGATREEVEAVLRFLERAKFWREAYEETIRLARQVHGRARDPHRENHPEEPGEVGELQGVRKELISAIRRALTVYYETLHVLHHAYDHGLTSAFSHLVAALNYLEQWPEVEVDPDLPKRVPGQKPGLRMALREGEEPQPVNRRDIESALQKLLLPLHPRSSKFEVKHLSYELLDPVLPKTIFSK